MKFYNHLLNLFFPRFCLNCRREGAWLCAKCNDLIPFTQEQICPQCKKFSKNNKICYNCKQAVPLKGIVWGVNYANPLVQKLIHCFKYQFIQEISEILVNLLIKRIDDLSLIKKKLQDKNSLFIPLPLSKARFRWRGFNQAEALAQNLSQIFNKKQALRATIIRKKKNTQPQAELKGEERKMNLKNAFSAQYDPGLTNQCIFLIDDVATTFSTLIEASYALLKAGNQPKEIWGLVIAKG